MRISDWSSDVCSSDLMDQLMREDGRALRRHGVRRVREVRPDEDFKMPVRAQPVIPALADRLALPARAGEIGRESCRERVCEYVSTSEVAVKLKKKESIICAYTYAH